MSATFYDGTIVVVQSILGTLTHILNKAEQHFGDASKITSLLEARLYQDMYPLRDQVRLGSQFAENLAARLTAREPETFQGELATLAQCYERIEKAQTHLKEADKNTVIEQENAVAPANFGPGMTLDINGSAFAHSMVIPNIYFHLNIAYAILRKEGVPLGKKDYYAGFSPKQLSS